MLGALILVLVMHHLWPLSIGGKPFTPGLGSVFCILGIASAVWGRITLVRAGTNVSPLKPTTAIVTGGPYRFTRNPLYVGIISFFVGLSLVIGTWWGLVVLVPAVLVLHNGVVLREEAYLERKFGLPYLEYKRSVRRYL
jgi:protein-S-isoprenylcysteine O-methyltransferase Ste14